MRRIAVGLVVLFLVTVALGGVAAGLSADEGEQSGGSSAAIEQIQQSQNFTDTSFEITVFENGDGRWAIRQRRPLETDTEVSDFETFAERFETEQTETFQTFRERAARLTESGSAVTDRAMTAEAFEREAFIDERGQQTGVIVMSFRWTNIAVTESDSDRVVLADIFDGGWSILESQRVIIQPGEQVRFATAPTPQPDSGLEVETLAAVTSVTYEGPVEFTDDRPRAVFEQAEGETGSDGGAVDDGTTDDGTTDGTTDDSGTADESTDDSSGDDASGEQTTNSETDIIVMAVAALLLVGVGGGLAWYAATRAGTDTAELSTRPQTGGETNDAVAEESVDPELVADEDRVLQLLEQNGGRMKQVEIVEETEWSKSKVSMLLSEMDDDEQISKLRVGRENIISLAGEEPDAASSPFEGDG